MRNSQLKQILEQYPDDMKVEIECDNSTVGAVVGDGDCSLDILPTVECFYNFGGNSDVLNSSDTIRGAGCITLKAGLA